jgi:hypothetical protein
MQRTTLALVCAAFVLVALALARAAEPGSDPQAVTIARTVLDKMGGQSAWDRAGVIRWDFMGRRRHWWDLRTGDIRIEADNKRIVLMNIQTKAGKVWQEGKELTGQELADALTRGHQWWVNDSYWMFMPYKMLDPGVTLRYLGERPMKKDGRAADVIEMTFGAGIGYTPQNKYEVAVAKDSGLVEEWAFFKDAKDTEPGFVLPWSGWKKFGPILLATDHGPDTGGDWNVAVFNGLPASVFTSPDPVGP